MTGQPLLHESTSKALQAALARKHHALCLIGTYGSGKAYLAGFVADNLLAGRNKTASLKRITSETGLGIEQIREIQSFLALKTTGDAQIKRVVIVEDAHTLSIEAQNALLKNLEEPPSDSVIILTVAGDKLLLPTLYSRMQAITIKPPLLDDVKKQLSGKFLDVDITKNYHISGGNMGLMHALLTNTDHELVNHIDMAKQLLKGTANERLSQVDQLAKEKPALPMLLYALKRVISATMYKSSDMQLRRTLHALKCIYSAEASLKRNPNTKLLLTDLFLQM